MRYLKIIVGTLFIILLVVFILRNDDLHKPVTLNFGLSIFTQGVSFEGQDKKPADTAAADTTTAETAAVAPHDTPAEGVEVPVFILVFLAFFFGLLVASALSLAEKYRLKRVVRAGNRRINDLEDEIKSLRNLPITQPGEAMTLPEPPEPPESDPDEDGEKEG